MEDMEQTAGPERAAAQDREPEGAVSMKFKDYGQLERAYRSLQAEFTRKCQRLSELERAGRATTTPRAEHTAKAPAAASEPAAAPLPRNSAPAGQALPQPGPGTGADEVVLRDLDLERFREEVIRNFLDSVAASHPAGQTVHGRAVAAPPARPKSFAEAGQLFLKNIR